MTAGVRLASWIERHERLSVATAALAFLVPMIRASFRPLWFDELFTYFISRLGSSADILRAIPADGNPPLNYLLAHACLRFGWSAELAVRIPSLVGFTMALLAVYAFVQRRLGVVPGLFAMLAIATSQMGYYAVEARPYGLLLGFTALALASWQAAADGGGRAMALCGVTAGIAGAIASHHYGLFHVGLPLFCGEAWRALKRRRADWPMYAACAAGLSALAITIPLAQATHRIMLDYVRQSQSFWARPELWQLVSYFKMIAWWVPVIAAVAVWMAARHEKKTNEGWASGMREYELTAAVALAALLVLMLAVTWVATGYFIARYAIGTVIGIAILAAAFMARWRAAAALCLPVMIVAMVLPLGARRPAIVNGRPVAARDAAPLDLETAAAGSDPIVVASALSFMPIWWYSSEALRGRLHYLADIPYAVHQSDFVPEISLVANQRYVPTKVDDFGLFVSTHTRFLLYCADLPRLEWTKDRLASERWTLSGIYLGRSDQLFLAQAPSR